MKTKNKSKLTLKIIGFLALGLIFGYTVGTAIHSKDKSKKIAEILKEECDCKEVNQLIYAKGIQYGKEGLTTEKAEYQLVDCDFELSKKKLGDLNRRLSEDVKNYSDIDYLELEFISNNESKIIVIKNGKIND